MSKGKWTAAQIEGRLEDLERIVVAQPDWYAQAACVRSQFSAFVEDSPTVLETCYGCPVRQQCLRFALDHTQGNNTSDPPGVWGGLTERERAIIHYALEHDEPLPHGYYVSAAYTDCGCNLCYRTEHEPIVAITSSGYPPSIGEEFESGMSVTELCLRYRKVPKNLKAYLRRKGLI